MTAQFDLHLASRFLLPVVWFSPHALVPVFDLEVGVSKVF
jgi:hypothetical protein